MLHQALWSRKWRSAKHRHLRKNAMLRVERKSCNNPCSKRAPWAGLVTAWTKITGGNDLARAAFTIRHKTYCPGGYICRCGWYYRCLLVYFAKILVSKTRAVAHGDVNTGRRLSKRKMRFSICSPRKPIKYFETKFGRRNISVNSTNPQNLKKFTWKMASPRGGEMSYCVHGIFFLVSFPHPASYMLRVWSITHAKWLNDVLRFVRMSFWDLEPSCSLLWGLWP